tara:strand:- start:50 stop:676 length:627 start_codon:yes stop_codon:yes gene_type:complete
MPTKNDLKNDFGLPSNSFVFACFNSNYKISTLEFDSWMRILFNTENSILWLLKDNNLGSNNLKKEAVKRGINPNRIIFTEKLSYSKHLERFLYADLFLDTFFCNAHTIASDAIWSGLPILTMSGQTFQSRVAGSLLKTIGVHELITSNTYDYEKKAIELYSNTTLLNQIKNKIKKARENSSLFNPTFFTKEIEGIYLDLFNLHSQRNL